MPPSSHNIDPIRVTFDHDHAVADAGLMLIGTPAKRLGLEGLADEAVGVSCRPGRKLSTLVHTIVAGGGCIDEMNLLSGARDTIAGFRCQHARSRARKPTGQVATLVLPTRYDGCRGGRALGGRGGRGTELDRLPSHWEKRPEMNRCGVGR